MNTVKSETHHTSFSTAVLLGHVISRRSARKRPVTIIYKRSIYHFGPKRAFTYEYSTDERLADLLGRCSEPALCKHYSVEQISTSNKTTMAQTANSTC